MTARSRITLALSLVLSSAGFARGQLDPLAFLRGSPPNVLLALDLSSRMQRDAHGAYYDPVVWRRERQEFERSLGIADANTRERYRRRYLDLRWAPSGAGVTGLAPRIEIIGDEDPRFAGFDGLTRLGRATAAILRAVEGNARSVRFGLLTSRQASPVVDQRDWATVAVGWPPSVEPTDTGSGGRWRAAIPRVASRGRDAPPAGARVGADAAAGNEELRRVLGRRPGDLEALLPAGADTPETVDAPLGLLIDDVRQEAARLIAADTSCRNTVVVLIASGGDSSLGSRELGDRASTLLRVHARRVPIYVVALAPDPADADQLRQVAARSGGQYAEISPDVLDGIGPEEVISEITRAINVAVQHAFANFDDFNELPTPAHPYGLASSFPTASPVVGTVNLESAVDSEGAPLPSTRVLSRAGALLPQRSNVMFTTGFELPGFSGRLSAFRVYRPVPDDSQATGYRFAGDGKRLWTARTPPASQRNIFTVLPGRGVIAFRSENAPLLAAYLRDGRPAALIEAIRALPLGPFVNSTPALLDPPSASHPDPDYQAFAAANGARRTLVFVGAADGMMHAVDGRTGIELWAVVPFNLLPKLRVLKDGWPLDAFPAFVDASPRLADVRTDGEWRTYLFFGEGPGGTFYQAFDVTLRAIADTVPPDVDSVPELLSWFANPRSIPFAWSYPRYEQFDPSIGRYGDVAASATDLEKTVGMTWSTPAVGRAATAGHPFVAVVGSGALPRSTERQANRGGTRAGTRLYLFDVGTGSLLDSRDVGSDGVAEEEEGCAAAGCARLKNALHADALASGGTQRTLLRRVYVGDLDGRLWRFGLSEGAGPPSFSAEPVLLVAAGADQPFFSSAALVTGTGGQPYLYAGTGSDLLPQAGITRPYRLLGLTDGASGAGRSFERLLRTPSADGTGELPAGAPAVAGGVVFFSTTAARGGNRCEAPEASVYALTIGGGTAYDSNGDQHRDARDSPVVARLRGGRATGPAVSDRHLFVTTGSRVQVFGDPETFNAAPAPLGIRILSWREIR